MKTQSTVGPSEKARARVLPAVLFAGIATILLTGCAAVSQPTSAAKPGSVVPAPTGRDLSLAPDDPLNNPLIPDEIKTRIRAAR